jgi:hypothetical protein
MYELFSSYGAMNDSIKSIIPSTNVIIQDLPMGDSIKFTMLDAKKMTEELKSCRDIRTLQQEISLLKDSSTDDRMIAKLDKLRKIKPVSELVLNKKRYDILPSIEVLQVLDESVLKQCRQHLNNINKGVYELRDKHPKRHLPEVGKTYEVSKLGRKLNFMLNKLGKKDPIELLAKIYSFERYDKEGNLISERSRVKVDSVKITGKYAIPDTWYEEGKLFHKLDFSTVRK